jgi:predicted phage terminase large subunit-like protein
VRYYDKAASVSASADYTAGALVAFKDGVWYIVDMRHMRGLPADVEAMIRQTAELDGRGMPIWIEQEPGSSGVDTISHYQRNVLVGYNVRGDRVTGNKVGRMGPLAAAAQAGNVRLLRGSWNAAFLAEAETVPYGEHDDQIDAVSSAIARIGDALGMTGRTVLNYDERVLIGPQL